MDIGKLQLARIKLETNERLLIKLPDDTDQGMASQLAKHVSTVFPVGSFLMYIGDIEFTKVTIGEQDGKSK